MPRMRAVWTISLALAVFFAAGAAARADPALWTIDVSGVTIQSVGDDDKPTGKGKAVPARPDGVQSCALAKPPKGTYKPWIQGFVQGGGFKMRHQKGGAPDDVINCAAQVLVNLKLPVEDGIYRVSAAVKFRPAR